MKMKQTLNIVHEHKMTYDGNSGLFSIMGRLPMDLSSLKVSVHLIAPPKKKQRLKLDLYDYNQIQKHCLSLSEKEDFNPVELEKDLIALTDLLEAHREAIFDQEYSSQIKKVYKISITKEKEAIALLSQKNLLNNLGRMLGESGIVGEVKNRLLLFIVAISYKTKYPLHALVNSSSGSGKSHLINAIADCLPAEEVISFSRVTSKSFYHYRKGELENKLVLIQDFDGLDEEALYALRELQSLGSLSSSITYKDKFGNLTSKTQTVEAHFSSMGATTKRIYTDNESRSILLKVDESIEQTARIIAFQNEVNQGLIDTAEIKKAKLELSNLVRMLKDVKIVNPYAGRINLPLEAKMLRRLNKQFQDFVCLIAFIHQYQRKSDSEGRVIATKEDVKSAIDLFFDSIWLKVDELEGSLRGFYEDLKTYLLERDKQKDRTNKSFTQREIRQGLNLSKSHCHRQLKQLLAYEYITIVKGSLNKGYQYKISWWDSFEQSRDQIKSNLLSQL